MIVQKTGEGTPKRAKGSSVTMTVEMVSIHFIGKRMKLKRHRDGHWALEGNSTRYVSKEFLVECITDTAIITISPFGGNSGRFEAIW